MKDRSNDPSHHEQTLLTTELHLAPVDAIISIKPVACFKVSSDNYLDELCIYFRAQSCFRFKPDIIDAHCLDYYLLLLFVVCFVVCFLGCCWVFVCLFVCCLFVCFFGWFVGGGCLFDWFCCGFFFVGGLGCGFFWGRFLFVFCLRVVLGFFVILLQKCAVALYHYQNV